MRWDTKLQCFLSGKVLVHASVKPAKLNEHLMFVHPANASDTVDICCVGSIWGSWNFRNTWIAPTQRPCLKAPYAVAYRITKEKKPDVIGEMLVKSWKWLGWFVPQSGGTKLKQCLCQMSLSTPELLTCLSIFSSNGRIGSCMISISAGWNCGHLSVASYWYFAC